VALAFLVPQTLVNMLTGGPKRALCLAAERDPVGEMQPPEEHLVVVDLPAAADHDDHGDGVGPVHHPQRQGMQLWRLAPSGVTDAVVILDLSLPRALPARDGDAIGGRGLPVRAAPLLGVGVDDLRWLAPVRPDDVIHIEGEVVELIPSKTKPQPTGDGEP